MFNFNQPNQLLSESSVNRITEVAPVNPTQKITSEPIQFNLNNVQNYLNTIGSQKKLDLVTSSEIAQIGKKATMIIPKVFVSEAETVPTNVTADGFVRKSVAQIKAEGGFKSIKRSRHESMIESKNLVTKKTSAYESSFKVLDVKIDPRSKKVQIENLEALEGQILSDYHNFKKQIKENNAFRADNVSKN